MSKQSTDQMLLMAQMIADVEGTDLRSRINSFAPLVMIVLTGLVLSTVVIHSAWQWQSLVEATLVETNQRAFRNEATLSLMTLKQNTHSLQGFLAASSHVSKEEFDNVSQHLLGSQAREMVNGVIGYRNHNYLASPLTDMMG